MMVRPSTSTATMRKIARSGEAINNSMIPWAALVTSCGGGPPPEEGLSHYWLPHVYLTKSGQPQCQWYPYRMIATPRHSAITTIITATHLRNADHGNLRFSRRST